MTPVTRELSPAPLAVTMGDPAGIGLDIAIDAWRRRGDGVPPFYVIAPPAVLLARSALLGRGVKAQSITAPRDALAAFDDVLPILPIEAAMQVEAGKPDAAWTPVIMQSIERAVGDALNGAASGVVTLPINKKVLQRGGFLYPGHTEYLAALCRNRNSADFKGPVMMLAAEALKVVPVTIHIPLSEVPAALSIELIVEKARLTIESLIHDYGIARPRLAVAGLNPHAGEEGAIGMEEQTVILPAVTRLRNMGFAVRGPLAADSLFHEGARQTYDAALCMYHDQALIPLKTLDFWGGVNTTLGLPIVRTSPDHGTAFDMAGTGEANAESLLAALRMADMVARNRQNAASKAGSS